VGLVIETRWFGRVGTNINNMKKKPCKICGKGRFKETYCYDCFKIEKAKRDKRYREKHWKRLAKKKKEWFNSGREWKCKHCKKKFLFQRPRLFCTKNCQYQYWKEYNVRKGKNNPAYRTGFYAGKRRITTFKHGKACKSYKLKQVDKVGYLKCELCNVSNSIRYETHHIIYASEAPKHKELHNHKNLILLCIKCHNWLHQKPSRRNSLVEERDLNSLFNMVCTR